MRGTQTITFDFDFDYAHKGEFDTANAIVVKAPGLKDYAVHAWMKAAVTDALFNFAGRFAHLRDQAGEEAGGGTSDSDEQDSLMILSGGMGKAFPEFVERLRKTLTKAPHLAHVAVEGEPPLTDKVWESLAEKGGLEACDRVLSGFCGLFLHDLVGTSPAKNGKRSRRG